MKKYYKELKTFEDFLETVPEDVKKNRVMMRNTRFLFIKLKEMRKDGKAGRFFFIKFLCPFCDNYDTIHQVIFEMKGEIKEKFDKDEPIKMICPKCNERSMFLLASGVRDFDVVKSVLKEMSEEDKTTIGA